ncbi:hypothetical protein Aduo_012442 [Ancylostoma duodenale]
MVAQHYSKGQSSRRNAIRRTVQVRESPEALASMEMIPDHLRDLSCFAVRASTRIDVARELQQKHHSG